MGNRRIFGFLVVALLIFPAPVLAWDGSSVPGTECSEVGGTFELCASTTSGWYGAWDNDWSNWFDDWDSDWEDVFEDWFDDWDESFDDWDSDLDEWLDNWHEKGEDYDSDDGSYGCESGDESGYKSCEVVPEPISTVLLGTGLFGVGGAAFRRRRGNVEVEDE